MLNGGARPADALELICNVWPRSRSRYDRFKRQVKGAMIYPISSSRLAAGILTFIMIRMCTEFAKFFKEFDFELPPMRKCSVGIAKCAAITWYLIPDSVTIWLLIKLIAKFRHGRIGWATQLIIKIPVGVGNLIEKKQVKHGERSASLVAWRSAVPIWKR